MTTQNLTVQAEVALDPMQGTLQEFHACYCIGPQAGQPACPCKMRNRAAPDSFARAPVVAKPVDRGILALDPGTDKTGWCLLLGDRVIGSGVEPNDQMLAKVQARGASTLAVEMIASYGMPVGREVFETCVWIGRFVQAWGGKAEMVYRKDVKMHLCGTAKAKDGNVRQAILDLYPRSGGGATPQVGTKAQPGPLHGVSTHAWAALGVAITARHRLAQERAA
ncbi:hypothetical protein D9M72_82830 [compost metagenome]